MKGKLLTHIIPLVYMCSFKTNKNIIKQSYLIVLNFLKRMLT